MSTESENKPLDGNDAKLPVICSGGYKTLNMSYDEQRISDQIDGGLLELKREHIKKYVKEWMEGHEPDTFVKNKNGAVIYSAGHSSLNLVAFFENLLEDYLDDNGL